MTVHVMLENRVDAGLIHRLVDREFASVEYADERSEAIMSACGQLRHEPEPVVLVLNADTLEERPLLVEQAEVEGLLRRSSVRTPYRLVLAVPQVEAILFADRAGLEKALGRKLADEDFFEGRFRPRAVFYRLLGNGTPEEIEEKALRVFDALDDATLRKLAKHPIVQEIEQFIAEVAHADRHARPARVRRAG